MNFLRISLFIGCLVFLISCENEELQVFKGEWQFVSTSGGIGGGGNGFEGDLKLLIQGDILRAAFDNSLILTADIRSVEEKIIAL